MLYKYNAKVYASLINTSIPIFNLMLFTKNFKRYRILDKWFYFYNNLPQSPVVVWNLHKYGVYYHLEPGTNRVIGTALREAKWIDAILITDDPQAPACYGIEKNELIDSIELTLENFDFKKKTPAIMWGVEPHTIIDEIGWYVPTFKWVSERLKNVTWILKYHDRKYLLNPTVQNHTVPHDDIGGVVDVADYPTILDAIKHLFEQANI